MKGLSRAGIFSIIGIVLIIWLVAVKPFGAKQEGETFQTIIYSWAGNQEKVSDEMTRKAVEGAEGVVAGEHKIDGSNWSIPNILRHWLGVG